LEIRVYTGADGDFTFYEDDGDTYDYEKGAFATIPIHWNEATHRLIIGARKGSYPGMPQTLPLTVVFVRKGTGIGFEQAKFAPREVIPYDGRMVEVTFSENLSGSDR
jgi:alpha-D-xyloside xylohydrolase